MENGSVPYNSLCFLLRIVSRLYTRVLRRQNRERKSRNSPQVAHPRRLLLPAEDLCTSLQLCLLHTASGPSTILTTAQGPGACESKPHFLAWERLAFHPSLPLFSWGSIYNKDMSKHDCKNCSRLWGVYTQQINAFNKKLYNCILRKIIINKIYVKIWYSEGSADQ